MNIKMNKKIVEKNFVDKFHVYPNASDAGIPAGAAYVLFEKKETLKPKKIENLYLGNWVTEDEILYDLSFFKDKIKFEKYTDYNKQAKKISEILVEGKVIGLFQGRAEWGPRALGNRTILADPRSHKAKDDINSKVKFREWYRPFAPVCKEDKANKYFESSSNACYKYMSFSPNVREEYRKLLPSVTHIDGSSRLQTVNREQNDYIYDILDSFEQITGIPILINTSFNTRGKAILTRYLEAIKVLDSTELDGVVLDNYYICK